MTDCVFCEIVKSGGPNDFERIGKWVVAFTPLNPVTPGHRLFVPVRHGEDAGDDPTWASMAFRFAADYAYGQQEDYNLITSGGKFATQTVFHTHIHYVPRRPDDGLMLPWTKRIGDSAWRDKHLQ